MALDGIRNWANENAGLAVIIFVVILIGTAAWLIRTLGGGPPMTAGDAWYYDPATKEYFAGDAALRSPIDHNGNPAYRAWFFDCGECKESTEPETAPAGFLGYYENFTPEGRDEINKLQQIVDANQNPSGPTEAEALASAQSQMMTITMKYKLVSRNADDPNAWEPPDPSRGLPIWFEEEVREKCRNQEGLKNCRPDGR